MLPEACSGTQESIGDSEALSGVDFQGAASSTFRSATPRPRAHSRDATLAIPALPRRHDAPTSLSMGGSPQSRDDCALGGGFLVCRCHNQLLGSGGLSILCLRPAGRMSPRSPRTRTDSVGADATGAALHAQPLADTDHNSRRVGTIALRDLANLARLAHCRIRCGLDRDGRCRRFPGPRSHYARLLCRLLNRPMVAT